ncbi:TetR/AcrR family transcriptional regulator [Staphylococcus capitis]|nr:TetR/AcrR family transcriptional regulator [Staphylococcus capitis]
MSSTIELSHSNIDITEMKMSDIAKHAGVGGGTLYRLLRARHVYANQLWTSRLKLCFKKLIRI